MLRVRFTFAVALQGVGDCMAWIYLAESAVLVQHSQASELEQSHIVNKTDTHKAFYCPECNQVTLIELQSGMTLERLLRDCCRQLTSFMVDFHVKTSVLLDLEKAWQESEAVYSTKLSDLQKKLTRRLCSSKMCQQLELEDFEKLSEHLPKSGMTVGGRVYLPQALELHTREKDGSYLPTLTAQRYGRQKSKSKNAKNRFSIEYQWKMGLIPTITVSQKSYDNQANGTKKLSISGLWRATTGTTMPASFCEWVMGINFGYTELNASATQWFHNKSKKHL